MRATRVQGQSLARLHRRRADLAQAARWERGRRQADIQAVRTIKFVRSQLSILASAALLALPFVALSVIWLFG